MKVFPWQFDSYIKQAILSLKIDLPINASVLKEEFLSVEQNSPSIVHPDIYHNGGWRGIPLHSKQGSGVAKFSGGPGEYVWDDCSKFAPYTKALCESVGSNLQRVR